MDSESKNWPGLSAIPLETLSREQLEQHRRHLADLLEQLTVRLRSSAPHSPPDEIVVRMIDVLNLKTFESMLSDELRRVELLLATSPAGLES